MDLFSYAIGKKAGGGGGSSPSGTISISANGTHNVASYASASVNVPNSYTLLDEGKVVNNGELVEQSSQTVHANGTYDTTLKSTIVVALASATGVSF